MNQRGFALLGEGSAVDAFSAWEEAEGIYRAEQDEEGIIGTQLNQALAQQALGMHPLACTTLTKALEISYLLCKPGAGQALVTSELARVEAIPVNTIGIRLLGEGLGFLSNLEEGKAALLIAQERATASSKERLPIDLALANIYNLSFQSAWQSYSRTSHREILSREKKLSEAITASDLAVTTYEEISNSVDEEASAKADLSTIGLLTYVLNNESGLNPGAETGALLEHLIRAVQQSYQRLDVNALRQLPALDSIYMRLNLATNLSTIKASRYSSSFNNLISNADISSLIEESTVAAERLGEGRALSSAYGTAGDYFKSTEVPSAAEQYHKALSIAQAIRADDIAYEWAYQLAQISAQQGNVDQTEQYYETALSALSAVRGDLLAVDSELRFSFKGKVEPVYENYIQFLIAQEKADLQKVIKVHNSLQLAQIENLLRCGRLFSAPESQKATVHLINLANVGDTIEVIISQSGQMHGYSVPAAEVLQAAENLAVNVQSPSFLDIPEEEFLPYARLLYDRLLRPAVEDGLLPDDAEISFVLDAPFQAIPMGLLHDGEQYLASSHPLSISLQMQKVNEPATGAGALFAGLSEESPSSVDVSLFGELEPLMDTEVEASYVSDYFSSEVLLNQQFTADNLEAEISKSDFEIVHISTHSQFGSEPDETFLLAWDQPINFSRLGQLFQQSRSIDLLFLSACQTAAGDERTSLGLAGLSIQSGAKNAVASLWLVDSVATSVLVDGFYKSLAEVGPAKALQQAQIALMRSSDDAFKHPYYWAPFVLAAS